MSYESLKSLFPRRSQCRRFPTFAGIEAEAQSGSAVFLRADVGRRADKAVVEVRDAHAAIDARVRLRALDAVLLGAAVGAEPAVVEIVVEVVARPARLVDRVPVRFPDLENVVARDGVGQ